MPGFGISGSLGTGLDRAGRRQAEREAELSAAPRRGWAGKAAGRLGKGWRASHDADGRGQSSAAGGAFPAAALQKMTRRFFWFFLVPRGFRFLGRCPRGEERAAIRRVEKGKRAGSQRVACAWRARRDGAASLPTTRSPVRVWGCSGGAVGLVRGLLHQQHHTWPSWELAPLKFGGRERSQRDAGEGAPLSQIRTGGRGGRGSDAEEGWR